MIADAHFVMALREHLTSGVSVGLMAALTHTSFEVYPRNWTRNRARVAGLMPTASSM
jgi:hypothetical protein